ncbi:MAG: sugar phosphate nucleotidyltransferase [Candidatus Levybacteria bacterium]|nr:sugar phosphate nucleotidyltransferase [Candidatus Levybacteria bacterium]
MKAIILAGGSGSRLHPLTIKKNKHLLELHGRPIICYALEKLSNAGFYEVMIITSTKHVEEFIKVLGHKNIFELSNGKKMKITYGIQNNPDGIAHGLYIAKDYVGEDNCVLYLGDNIFEDDISKYVKNFNGGAKIFLKPVFDPQRFGIATLGDNNKVIAIEEKPLNPKSNLAVTGLYFYDNTVFEKIANQSKSDRGEYEITDINNKYIAEDALEFVVLQKDWFDIGTIESLYLASAYMRNKYENYKK